MSDKASNPWPSTVPFGVNAKRYRLQGYFFFPLAASCVSREVD